MNAQLDMSTAITPKSDQLNSDDLIAGPRPIRISKIDIKAGTEQPVAISFDGDNGKPWKPCKSMSRVLVAAWGADANKYVGRSLTLYRDPTVKWAGMEVGGIRVSHMSHIERDMVMALTATKGKRSPYTVRVLQVQQPEAAAPTFDIVQLMKDFDACETLEQFEQLEAKRSAAWSSASKIEKSELKQASDDAKARFVEPSAAN